MKIEFFRSFDDLVLTLGRYVGRSTLPSLIRRLRETGAAWCHYGVVSAEGKSVVRTLQVCRLASGIFAVHDRSYSRIEPSWSWVADADLMADKSPAEETRFETAAEILMFRRRSTATMPLYARPDVPAGE